MNVTVEHMSRRGPRKRNIKSRVIRVRISEQLYQHLKDHSEATGQPISRIVRLAILKFYRESPWAEEMDYEEEKS